jgi:LuxR family maltose regulon positive regulatory protein
MAWLVRGLAMQALIDYAQGRRAPALTALAEALTLAEPEGYVRSFVDLGPAMAVLLKQAAAQGITRDYVSDLLAAIGLPDAVPSPPVSQPLIEPLSARELEVLALVAEGFSNAEAGRRLHVAESTVKSHLNSVYGKLGVRNRTQAAAKAKALNLID